MGLLVTGLSLSNILCCELRLVNVLFCVFVWSASRPSSSFLLRIHFLHSGLDCTKVSQNSWQISIIEFFYVFETLAVSFYSCYRLCAWYTTAVLGAFLSCPSRRRVSPSCLAHNRHFPIESKGKKSKGNNGWRPEQDALCWTCASQKSVITFPLVGRARFKRNFCYDGNVGTKKNYSLI